MTASYHILVYKASCGVGLFGNAALKGGRHHPRLNMDTRPIANKYREGKMKSTLERGFKEDVKPLIE